MLDDAGALSAPVYLRIRPEDLTRTEPSRVAVHQTLGRDVSGWVDNFGAGLPSLTIAGHTGWRWSTGSATDGATAFDDLNFLVADQYHQAKQRAIDDGLDPALVRLIFVDTLDNFAWSVVPTQFVLRRSKSRPLLYQYNIALQALATSVDTPLVIPPIIADPMRGIGSLADQIEKLTGLRPQIVDWVGQAMAYVDGAIGPVTAAVGGFVDAANAVFLKVQSTIGGANDLATGVASRLIGIARQMATVGVNVFRTVNAIAGLPGSLKAKIGAVAAAYNEVLCIFSNALKPKKAYEQYTGLYGASNCSSTVGGRPPSGYLDANIFELMVPETKLVDVTGEAMGSLKMLGGMDPVLAPLPFPEIARLSDNIANGVTA